MATNFPTTLDSLTNPTATQTLNSPSHSSQHANVNDAIEAIQAKIGVDNSAITSTLDYKVRVNTPTGTINLWATTTAPSGWLICDGSPISRSTYLGLFNVIGTTYGAGDGSTTFNLPNLKGRIPVGRDASDTDWDVMGETRGSKTNALSSSNLPAHTHDITVATNTTDLVTRLGTQNVGDYATGIATSGSLLEGTAGFGLSNTTYGMSVSFIYDHGHAGSTVSGGGNGTSTGNSFSVIQPSIVLNYIIKA